MIDEGRGAPQGGECERVGLSAERRDQTAPDPPGDVASGSSCGGMSHNSAVVLERLQVLPQIVLLVLGELQLEHHVVVLDHILQGLGTPVMEVG